MTRALTMLAMTLVMSACAPDLAAQDDDNGAASQGVVDDMGGPEVSHTDEGDGVFLTRVDATAEDRWIYVSLVDGVQLDVDDPQIDASWDLAFQRFQIKLDGGVSGPAGVEAVVIDDAAFEDVEQAPADGYVGDQPDGDDDNEDPDYALREWYDYNIMTHLLTPAPVVYVIRTGDERHYKLAIEAYYDDAGTSGHVSFRWAPVDAP